MVQSQRVSGSLSFDEVERLWEAAVFAYCMNRPLNHFTTIHLKQAGIVNPHPFVDAFMKLAGDWSRPRFGSSIFVWVLENPPSSETKFGGLNLHILRHLPAKHLSEIKKAERGWITISGGEWKRGVLHSKPIHHSALGDDVQNYFQKGLLGLLRYISKGIDPVDAARFHIEPASQGVIHGKRSGYAQALGVQHRYHSRQLYPDKKFRVPGDDCRRRNFLRAVCPELLRLAPPDDETENELDPPASN